MALLHESSVLNIHSAVISPCDCNYYYWTIVIALLLSAIRQLCGSYIALRLQLLLLDNSYCSALERHSAALRQLYRPATAIITIEQ
ncbi:MAG: hypothetical protein SWX82_22710 [Cyanobacteriota bacterium]|nr:hypothetical protein [Cyanobacteriota bacterium]